ncbi:MAG: histidinol dehydrogenase [Enterocloster bolteae]
MRIVTLDNKSMENILADMLKRDPNNYDSYTQTVQAIVDDVKARGDEALFEYTKRFDGASLDGSSIRVTREEIDEAMKQVEPGLLKVMERSMDNIRRYHEKQRQNSWFDAQLTAPSWPEGDCLESVGVYVPGGKAAYPSSVLMNIIPAEVAGVKRIAMVTPPGKDGKVNPVTLTAAYMAGATEVYKAGGAQAVAALAFGTASIPRVNKIVGPGNIFVALAKKAVYGHVSIDSIAGPSEILVIADDSANPRFVAADLLSQAEHDELASSILVTTSMELARKVSDEVDGFLKVLSRSDIIKKSLDNYGYILVADSMEKAVETANSIARSTWKSSPGIP